MRGRLSAGRWGWHRAGRRRAPSVHRLVDPVSRRCRPPIGRVRLRSFEDVRPGVASVAMTHLGVVVAGSQVVALRAGIVAPAIRSPMRRGLSVRGSRTRSCRSPDSGRATASTWNIALTIIGPGSLRWRAISTPRGLPVRWMSGAHRGGCWNFGEGVVLAVVGGHHRRPPGRREVGDLRAWCRRRRGSAPSWTLDVVTTGRTPRPRLSARCAGRASGAPRSSVQALEEGAPSEEAPPASYVDLVWPRRAPTARSMATYLPR